MLYARTEVADGIERVIYPNGLSLTLRADWRVPIAAVRCYVRGGSIAEELPGGRGIAHLLEHLIASAAAEEMERHGDGALLNAFTAHDYTCFHWSAVEEDVAGSIERWFAALSRIASLAFDLDAEKSVVLQEIELSREKHLALFQQRFLEHMFETHPVRYPVSGYAAALRQVSPADIGRYVQRLYTGANLRLAVAGAFEAEHLADRVDEACRSLGGGPRFELGVEEPTRSAARVFEVDPPAVARGYTQVGLRVAGDFEDAVAFAALARSVHASRDLTFGAEEIEARSIDSAFHAGYFSLRARHAAGDGAASEDSMRRWLDDVAAGRVPVPLDDSRACDDEPTLDGWTTLLGSGDVRFGDPLRELRFRQRLATIGEQEVRSAVARHATAGNLTIGRFGWSAGVPARPRRVSRPVALRLDQTLPNGARIVVLPTPNAQASCQILWRGGVFAETEETSGVCSLMARLLTHGAPSDFYSFCDENFCGLSLTTRARDLEAGLDRLMMMAIEPAFAEEAFEQARRATVEWLASSRRPWLSQLQGLLKKQLYRRHPYGRRESGRVEALRRLTLDDVIDCHRRVCTGGNLVTVVTGSVEAEHIREHLSSQLGVLPSAIFDAYGQNEIESSIPTRETVARPWSFGALAIGYRGIAWEPQSWCVYELLAALLVGPENRSVRGRLIRALREQGAAYQVHCQNQAGFGEGAFAVLAAIAPDKEAHAVAVAEREIDRLRSGDLTDAELDHCRKLYLLQHLRRYESPRAHAYAAGKQLFFSSSPASWDAIADQLQAVTVRDVASAAQRAFVDGSRGVVLVRPQGD